ncbi:MAG: hypothetical protein GXP30_02155 [Verrucomicrobia bacterium]|nr:hypothetical protein [Verrucomicrobiota bacterium]
MLIRLFRVCVAILLLTAVSCVSSRDTFSLNDGEPKQGKKRSPGSVSYAISWNIHKASDERFAREIGELLADIPEEAGVILCLQEARSSTYELIKRKHRERVSGHYTSSWRYPFSRKSTGVLTVRNGGNARVTAEPIRAPFREFYAVSPKVSLRSEFDTGGDHTLEIINCHGLNFVSIASFEKQLDEIFKRLQSQEHPAIVCGDFNVWNAGRLEILREKAKQIGLSEAINRSPGKSASPQWLGWLKVINGYDPDLHLDRFFTRGVEVLDCYSAKDTVSSDHLPQILRFRILSKGNR